MSEDSSIPEAGHSKTFMRELYRITMHYTAAAQLIPEPREVDLDTLTVVGGIDTEIERLLSRRQPRSTEWDNVTTEEMTREFNNYPDHVIPEDEGKEIDMRQQYFDCLNRTVTLLQDIDIDSPDEIPNDELFDIPSNSPTIIHRTFLADAPHEEAPYDDILPTTIERHTRMKRTAEQVQETSHSPQKKRKTK